MRWSSLTLEPEMEPEELAFLLRILETSAYCGKHLEIGTGAGGTLCAMLAAYEKESRPPFVVVDTMSYFPDQLEVICENLSRCGIPRSAVEIRVMTSRRALATARRERETFDFILVDSKHTRTSVMTDLRWTALLRVGGIVCVHDYSERYAGVCTAVDRFRTIAPEFEEIGRGGSLLAFRKVCDVDRQGWIYRIREQAAIVCAALLDRLPWRRKTRSSDYEAAYVESEWLRIARGRPHPTLGPRARDNGVADFQGLLRLASGQITRSSILGAAACASGAI